MGITAPTIESIKDSTRPEDLEVEPILIDSLPREPEHPDMPIPPELATFCCPNGMHLKTASSSGGVPNPKHFAQVLAVGTVGTTIYCYCIHFYDRMDPQEFVDMFSESSTKRPHSRTTCI